MSDLRLLDLKLISEALESSPGYVLGFTTAEFVDLFAVEFNVDIDHPRYTTEGSGSKGKRLRSFLKQADNALAAKVLEVLWQHREHWRPAQTHLLPDAPTLAGRYHDVVNRLRGGAVAAPPFAQAAPPPPPAWNTVRAIELRRELLGLAGLTPQDRGYAFERLLQRLFASYGLSPHSPFRRVGDQIDGSFVLDHEVYLVEAKWRAEQSDINDLLAFNGKVARGSVWARGLFISESGFTQPGLQAARESNVRQIVCMDGLDIADSLERELPLDAVLRKKVRHAAERGQIFAPVRSLF